MTIDDLRADPRPLVAIRAAAAVLGIPASTVYDCLKRAGAFPVEPVRIGRRVFLRKADVLFLVDGAREPGADDDRVATPAEA